MKKKTFMLMLTSLFLLKGIAQEVVPVQSTLITKRTATWCSNCGSWGWSLFKNLLEDNKSKAVFFAAHFSGDLANTTATQITTNFEAAYQPVFYLNEINQNANSSNGSTVRNSVAQKVDAAFAQQPIANVGFDSSYANGTMTVNAKVKFFQPANGEYYLGLYLVEDNVVANQASVGANANHRRVLRSSFSSSTWGELIGNGSFNAGQEYSFIFSQAVANPAAHDYSLVGVIWKKEGDKYKVLNTWSSDIQGGASVTEEPASAHPISVVPNLVRTSAQVQVLLNSEAKQAILEVYDGKGARLKGIFAGNLAAGQHSFELNRENAPNGIYFLRFSADGQEWMEKVVFQ
jgi:hypothetical protein